MDRAEFLRRAAVVGLLASTGPLIATRDANAAGVRRGLTYRCVTYDTGTEHFGVSSRLVWTDALMAADLRAIDERLHCNAVSVFGTDVDRLTATAIGLDYYSFHRDRTEYARELAQFRRWSKPIMILEFGSCTYRGAPERGGLGYDIVDWDKPVPEIIGDPVRGEREQADHIATMLQVFEAEGFLGASPYTFVAPEMAHSPNPRYDLDMASFSLVKVVRRDHADPASPYRWAPKLSFAAVARHYRNARDC